MKEKRFFDYCQTLIPVESLNVFVYSSQLDTFFLKIKSEVKELARPRVHVVGLKKEKRYVFLSFCYEKLYIF